MPINNALAFHCEIFHIYPVLSCKLLAAKNLNIFRNSKVTDALELPPNDFRVLKMLTEKTHYCIKLHEYQNGVSKASDSAFTVNV